MSRRTDDESIEHILSEIESQTRIIDQQSAKLNKIENLLIENAVQNTKIKEIQLQLATVWGKYDNLCGPEGTISTIKRHQANCPKTIMEVNVSRLWWAIGLLTTVYLGTIGALTQYVHSIFNHVGKP